MSFDLAVWSGSATTTDEEAERKYLRLTELPQLVMTPAQPQVAAFYRELTSRYPELEDDLDRSPWNARLTVTDEAVVMPVAWPLVNTVEPVVRMLAVRHGLVVYDPQRGVVNPLVLTTFDGSRVDDPDAAAIEKTLRGLSSRNWFAVLERGGHFVQAARREGWYALERRDGGADRHFCTEVSDIDSVVGAFTGFARDDAWAQRFTWEKLELC